MTDFAVMYSDKNQEWFGLIEKFILSFTSIVVSITKLIKVSTIVPQLTKLMLLMQTLFTSTLPSNGSFSPMTGIVLPLNLVVYIPLYMVKMLFEAWQL